jgi:hypothetical protein
MAYANTSPADALREIIAAGVARYQESLPDYARDPSPIVILPDHALADVVRQPNVSAVDEDRQREICLGCTLPDCLGVENPRCLIRIEQRRVWRSKR